MCGGLSFCSRPQFVALSFRFLRGVSAGARLTRVSMRVREHLFAVWHHDLVPDPPQQDPTLTPNRHRKRLRRRESMNSPRFLTFSCYRQLQLFGTPALRGIF